MLTAVPGEVPCGSTRPGVRCAYNPCASANCPAVPAAACVPFFCQTAVPFRGANITQRPCTAVFVDPDSGNLVDCTEPVRPLPGGDTGSGTGRGSSSRAGSPAAAAALAKAAAALAASGGTNASVWQTFIDSGQ